MRNLHSSTTTAKATDEAVQRVSQMRSLPITRYGEMPKVATMGQHSCENDFSPKIQDTASVGGAVEGKEPDSELVGIKYGAELLRGSRSTLKALMLLWRCQ